ncbi:uncharacterized protein LOC135084284 isoform X2 [Ostrinia nubilalis]|uniref:uncharacterized protein LOC135084284 isoform X2 n=1 Tax=Ostrinia nubilalis TaxID=29057 RepID=UPI0030822407
MACKIENEEPLYCSVEESENEGPLSKKKRGESKKWILVNKFSCVSSAEESVRAQKTWAVRSTHSTLYEKKRFYRCIKVPRKGVQCAAAILMLFKFDTKAVLLYRTECEHDHDFIKKNYGYGICAETKSAINNLLDLHLKPNKIMECLKKNSGLQMPTKRQLYNYLADRRRIKVTVHKSTVSLGNANLATLAHQKLKHRFIYEEHTSRSSLEYAGVPLKHESVTSQDSDHSGDDGGSEDDLLYDSSRKSKGAVHSVPKTPCSLCKKSITGFVFVCVQCNVRACGTCDARGLHAKHFVLRAPSGSAQNDLNLVLGKIRDALQSSGFVRAPDTRSDNREGSDADNEEEFEVKTEIKLEIDVEEQDPLLESAEYDELFAPGAGAARGSQVVPEQEIKSEPPDTSSPVSLSTDIASSRRQSAESAGSASDSDSQPLAKRKRIDQGQPTASPKPSPLRSKDIEKPDKEILDSDPNTDPGSPSAAGAITRLKE